jgi:hypothetical protein
MINMASPQIIQGTPISPGLAEGIIHVHHNLLGPIDTLENFLIMSEYKTLEYDVLVIVAIRCRFSC